ncbi:hypothetical protein [Pseudomonas sp. ICMP 460]|uniref:hypothetical protein n=1 Tax=Pseudomonas sp. ICMP 460 TaxID=1718917 RepID=UPI0015B27E83
MAREAGHITGWRISRYAKGRAKHTDFYARLMKNGPAADMTAEEVAAFEASRRL